MGRLAAGDKTKITEKDHKAELDREARRFEEHRKHFEVERVNLKAALLQKHNLEVKGLQDRIVQLTQL